MARLLAILFALSISLSACRTEPSTLGATSIPVEPSPTPGVPLTIVEGDTVTVFVEPSITHQTVKDVTGGNFINVFSGTKDPLEPVSMYNLENLDVRVARVRMTLEEWELVNDNDDPLHFSWGAFQDTDFNHASFQLMQELQARGTDIIVSTWDVPDWLVANPEKDTKRFIPILAYLPITVGIVIRQIRIISRCASLL